MDWGTETAKLAAIGAFPWISEFRRLDVHFNTKGIKLSSIYNFFASLFATGIYSYSYYIDPYQSTDLPPWYFFLLMACLLTIIYFSLFFYFKERVEKGGEKGIVIVNFFLYILIFCSLTFGFSILKIFKDDLVIHGRIYDDQDRPAHKTDIEIRTVSNRKFTLESDDHGIFTLFLDRKYADSIEAVHLIDRVTGEELEVNTFGRAAVLTLLKDIKLTK